MTNFISRPVIGMATFITEYTTNPMLLVSVFSMLNSGVTMIIKDPNTHVDFLDQSKSVVVSEKEMRRATGREPPFNASFKRNNISALR